ncbi:MAG: PAS domain-containing protein [Chlorobi bacterium]|nr:PAS domain-containing protein [Chlorobiota bacterium]
MDFTTFPTELILDSISEGVFTVDKNFRIQFFNRAAEAITGHRRENVVGRFCKQVFQAYSCEDECPITRVLQTGSNITDFTTRICHGSRETIPIRLNASVLYGNQNDPIGGVISFRSLADNGHADPSFAEASRFHGVVGRSKAMRQVFDLIEEISDSDATVLIQGESGTGKEMIANAIHATSRRRDKPYIKINCSVFPPDLLASELFGHVKGAFTGAMKDRPGRFELADGGTLFLDEVAEMPLQMQVQLLRVLQEGTFERIGESITRRSDVRVIASTNVNIDRALQEGKFREDLYYRLNVIPIDLPPLRERPEDIPHLVKHFLRKYSTAARKKVHEMEDEALDCLIQYPWPGNVRELENAIEYAFARTTESVIRLARLPLVIRQYHGRYHRAVAPHTEEAWHLLALLEKHHWNRSRVARELGIGRTTLWRRMKTLGIAHT